jgi:general secretion pathway protein A
MAKISVYINDKKIKDVSLKPGLTSIGRAADRDIHLPDDNVSRNHARIQGDISETHFIFEDLKSLNGSFLNQKKIGKKLLEPGDNLNLGQHILKFSTE